MTPFTPSRRFRRDYDRLFRKDPAAANVMLLLCELADMMLKALADREAALLEEMKK